MSYDQMHWKKLKALVEEKGGEWIDKESALKFLDSIEVDEDIKKDDEDIVKEDITPDEQVSNDPVLNLDEYYSTASGDTNIRYTQNGHAFDCVKAYIDPEDIE